LQVLSERHYPLRPVYNDTVKGVVLTVDGVDFTPEELVAMVLSHAVDISVAYSLESGSPIPPPTDCVLTVSCYATQQERRALLDAAALADLNVLTLVEENTAAALQYAMDKTFTDGEELILFYNMGASALQVSLVRFFSYEPPVKGYAKPKSAPGFEVLAKAWDDTCGGLAFDHLIVEHLADEFNQQYEKARGKTTDVRNDPRAMTKLRIQANKIKHVLSANTEMPVYMEGIHDDVALKTTVTRTQMEALSSSLLKRATAPVQLVLERANKTLQELTAIELIGGGMRIPRVQAELSKAVGGMDLGMHINADESMALGAAFAGANISTAFRVRHVGMTDVNPFAMNVTLSDIAVDDVAAKEGEEEEPWMKQATIFKALGKMGVKKTIAFTHDKDVHCSLDYQDNDMLPSGTELSIERYNVTGVVAFAKEMEEKGLGKPKVSLQFELNPSGITALVKAEAAVEETYTVEEEVEVDEEVDANATDADSANATDTDSANATDTDSANATAAANATEGADNATKAEAKNATKAEKKPKKTIMVEKVS
jgi:hypoxia up-regulated 1